MRLIVSTAVLATFFAVPAHARDGHFYIGGDLGLILAADSDLEFVPGGVAGSTGSADLNIGTGYFLRLKFSNFNAERWSFTHFKKSLIDIGFSFLKC